MRFSSNSFVRGYFEAACSRAWSLQGPGQPAPIITPTGGSPALWYTRRSKRPVGEGVEGRGGGNVEVVVSPASMAGMMPGACRAY